MGKDHIRDITDIQIDYLRQRLQAQNIKLNISEAALDRLGEAGFDPVYGARPLKRAIQQNLENPLAQEILAAKFVTGDTINIDWRDEAMIFSKT